MRLISFLPNPAREPLPSNRTPLPFQIWNFYEQFLGCTRAALSWFEQSFGNLASFLSPCISFFAETTGGDGGRTGSGAVAAAIITIINITLFSLRRWPPVLIKISVLNTVWLSAGADNFAGPGSKLSPCAN